MNKVITINLRGRAYAVEEDGFNTLRAYLDTTATKLADNPDKEEIMADFEQAIAEKCDAYLSVKKNVVTKEEVEKILKEMGPVESGNEHTSENDSEKTSAESQKSSSSPSKRLYRIREGAILYGVANGLAEYLDIDVRIIRILFIFLTIFSGGGWIIVYVVMAIIIPRADTPEDKARAFGTDSVTARSLIEEAKQNYKNFKNSDDWKKWRDDVRNIKDHARTWRHEHRAERRAERQARRRAYRYGYWHDQGQYGYNRCDGYHSCRGGPLYGLTRAVMSIVWFLILVFAIWFAYHHVTIIHQFLDSIAMAWNNLMYTIVNR